ncbi:MAG: C40 family peptidase [Magnetococcales bacterium]|nr:C40 family peptidase [Magnetococcales bacterium]
MHTCAQYIGLPYLPDGQGPHAFNCWTFVRWVQKEQFNRTLPEIPISGSNLTALARAFRDHPERQRWQRVTSPQEGDCVLLRQSRIPIHIGIWMSVDNSGVLHCVPESGVVFQSIPSLNQHGWQVEGFYRFQPA